MSGRRIDDHASFAGKGSKYPFADGNKMKEYHSAEGSAGLDGTYPDTSEDIHSDQKGRDSKVKGHKIKPGYRY